MAREECLAHSGAKRMSESRWFEFKTFSRFIKFEDLRDGDIVMKMPDGSLYLIGSGGGLRKPSPWDRFLRWIGR